MKTKTETETEKTEIEFIKLKRGKTKTENKNNFFFNFNTLKRINLKIMGIIQLYTFVKVHKAQTNSTYILITNPIISLKLIEAQLL